MPFREDFHRSSATGRFSTSGYWLRQHNLELPDVAIGPACRTGTNHTARRRHCEAIGSCADTAFRLCRYCVCVKTHTYTGIKDFAIHLVDGKRAVIAEG